MAFMNEFISAGDYVEYGLAEIDRYYLKSDFKPHWTIDHDRSIYLRQVASGRDEFAGNHIYTLYWERELIHLELCEKVEINPDLVASINYVLLAMNLPAHLQVKRSEMLADMKRALVARNGSGVYSSGITRPVTFEF